MNYSLKEIIDVEQFQSLQDRLNEVYGIMKGHGGAVVLKSAPGTGTTCSLYIPAAERAAENALQANSTPKTLPMNAGQRVLYIDDEEALASLAKRMFARVGHSVSAYVDPIDALEEFRSRPDEYEFVVTDLSMPKMSGFDITRALRSIRPEIPVIITT